MRRVRIRAASQALDVPVPTLRRWTQEFAAGLSPEARASEGRPRDFNARDMRVLRRVKEILRREDVTYERARRELANEGLLTYEPDEHESPNGKSSARDLQAEREAAERFVVEVVERAVAGMKEQHAVLVAKVAELERELRALREQPAAARAFVSPGGEQGVQPIGMDAERRRGWRFR
jgi:DNA-binding transcriptional MerR regulator